MRISPEDLEEQLRTAKNILENPCITTSYRSRHSIGRCCLLPHLFDKFSPAEDSVVERFIDL